VAALFLANPKRKKRRTMTAKQRKFFGPRRAKRSKRRAAPLAGFASNPRRKGPRRRRSRSLLGFRRNPISFDTKSFIGDTLVPAGIGAVGAMAVDVMIASAASYLPASLTSGIGNTVARIGAAIGVGMIAQSIGGRRFGEQVMVGGVVVTLYDAAKPWVAGQFPSIPGLGYMGWTSPGVQLGTYVDLPGNGNYVPMIEAAPMDMTQDTGMGSYVDNYGYN
jgi:hypothetical protein